MRRSQLGLLAVVVAVYACGRDQPTAQTGYRPSFFVGESSDDEELIGGPVYGASGSTVYTVSIGNAPIYFGGSGVLQNKHRWGIFSPHTAEGCPASEQHFQTASQSINHTPPSGSEEHCGLNGPYGVTVSGGGKTWVRDIMMLDERGVPAETGSNGHQDVNVPLDVGSPSTTLSGSLRRSTAYHLSTDTASFSTGGVSVTTGDSLWFVSTFQGYAGGSALYDYTEVLNSYNFDADRAGEFLGAVNSSHPNASNWFYPFLHTFYSPGRTRVFKVVLRVVEPYHAQMTNGRRADSLSVTVAADSACWTSPGGVAGTSVNFSASCSDGRNAGVAEYQWVWGDSSTSAWSTAQGATHTYSTSGTKTVKLRIRLSTGEGGMDSTTHTVTILEPVVLTWTQVTVAAKPNVSCSWWVSATGGSGSIEIAWTRNGSPVGQNKNKLFLNTGTSNFLLRVIATDAATALADTLSRNVTVSSGTPENCVIL